MLPHASNAIASIMARRSVVLDTATYTIVPPTASGTINPQLQYTFPPQVVQPGNQVRFMLFGTVTNTNTSAEFFLPGVLVQQTAIVSQLGSSSSIAASSTTSWTYEGVMSFSQPGPAGRGTLSFDAASGAQNGYTGGASNTSLLIGGFSRFLQTDGTISTPFLAGGTMAAGATDARSTSSAQKDPNNNLLQGYQPVLIQVYIQGGGTSGSHLTATVQGGYLESL